MFWGSLGCFNGPHDGEANGSNSQTSLPHAIGSPTDSRTVLPRAVIWYPARCSAAHKE